MMKEYVFHSFKIGDVDDPEVYAYFPIAEWKKTEQGQWVMEHCSDPQYRFRANPQSWGHQVEIYGPLSEPDAVIFLLKWQNQSLSQNMA
jgi:hypothetical protein